MNPELRLTCAIMCRIDCQNLGGPWGVTNPGWGLCGVEGFCLVANPKPDTQNSERVDASMKPDCPNHNN